MYRLLLFIACSFIYLSSWSQTREVKGVVMDARDLSTLSSVKILTNEDKLADTTNAQGLFDIQISESDTLLTFSLKGYKEKVLDIKKNNDVIKIYLEIDPDQWDKVMIKNKNDYAFPLNPNYGNALMPVNVNYAETYDRIFENKFIKSNLNPVSTFAINVDRASYSNVRRFIDHHQQVPPEAVRVEELINYFNYSYPEPKGNAPIDVSYSYAGCPWWKEDDLLRINIQAKHLSFDSLPPSNLVFLIDVSGSMGVPNKLPLLQAAFRLLVKNLRPVDKVSIVVYAGAAGIVLKPTPGDQQQKILNAIDNLNTGGSTAGGEGIKLAYKTAAENYIAGGNNRVILATDGDFNVGQASDDDMKKLILQARSLGVYLTCLGVGMGNYKDSKLETLARWGNGNFAYLDNLEEAEKIFIEEFGGTLYMVARNARIAVTFNPAKVQAYRLIGYENRMTEKSDSLALPIEGGEIGSGMSVTAFYEIIPVDISSDYLANKTKRDLPDTLGKLFEKKPLLGQLIIHYKNPDDTTARQTRIPINDQCEDFNKENDNFRFAASVALFGMLLRGSHYTGNGDFNMVYDIAKHALGEDKEKFRRDFTRLVKDYSKDEKKRRRNKAKKDNQ